METKAALPIQIGSKIVKNRVTFAPTVKFGLTDDSGIPVDRFRRHYEDRAKGGAGLICVEATCVEKGGRLAPSQLGLWDDAHHLRNERIRYGACDPACERWRKGLKTCGSLCDGSSVRRVVSGSVL